MPRPPFVVVDVTGGHYILRQPFAVAPPPALRW